MNKKQIRKHLAEIERYLTVIERAKEYIEGIKEQIEEELDYREVDIEDMLPPKKEKEKVKINLKRTTPKQEEPEEGPEETEMEMKQKEEPEPEQELQFLEQIEARKKHVEALLEIDCWPEAVPEQWTAKPTVEDQVNRANIVLDTIIDQDLNEVNFLDFGCGDGWTVKEATRRGVMSSTGFDILTSNTWRKLVGPTFTIVFKDLKPNFYDVVLLYDVLDHSEDPVGIMKQVRSLVKKTGTVYVRCHPWASKHASHLYKGGINKAYIHLFLTWEELVERGYTPLYTRTEKNALEAYHWWITGNQFKIVKEQFVSSPLSDFFLVPSFKDLIINEQQLEDERREGFFKDMSIEFADFQIVPI